MGNSGHYGLKKRPGSDNWYINLVVPGGDGKMHVESTHTADLNEAKRMRDEVLVQLRARDPRKMEMAAAASMPIDVFAEKVLVNYQKKKPGTYKIVARALRKLVDGVAVKTLGDITPAALEALRAYWVKTGHIKVDKTGNPIGKENIAGANREIRALVTVMRWAEDSAELSLPIQNWRRVIKGQWDELRNRTLFYTAAQHKKLRADAGDGLMLTLYMLAYHAGLRCGELRHLRREDIDFDRARIYIRSKSWTDTTTGRLCHWSPKGSNPKRPMERTVPIDKELLAYLTSWLTRIPGDWVMSEDLALPQIETTLTTKWGRIVKGTKENPGVGVGSIHTLRHCFATDWLSRGEPLENVQRFLGHSAITTTQEIYNHFLPTQFATAAR